MTLALGLCSRVEVASGVYEWRFSSEHTYMSDWHPTDSYAAPYLGIYVVETGKPYQVEDQPVEWGYQLNAPRENEFMSWEAWRLLKPWETPQGVLWVRGTVSPSDASESWYPSYMPRAHAFTVFRSDQSFLTAQQAELLQLTVTAKVGGIPVKGVGRILLGSPIAEEGTYGDIAADVVEAAPSVSRFWTHFVYSYEQL